MMKLLGKEGQAMLIVKYLFSMMLPKVAYAMNLALFDVESSEFVAATIRNAIRLRRENKVKQTAKRVVILPLFHKTHEFPGKNE